MGISMKSNIRKKHKKKVWGAERLEDEKLA
jgi:hypothetical protein